jgi:hypothetical protein
MQDVKFLVWLQEYGSGESFMPRDQLFSIENQAMEVAGAFQGVNAPLSLHGLWIQSGSLDLCPAISTLWSMLSLTLSPLVHRRSCLVAPSIGRPRGQHQLQLQPAWFRRNTKCLVILWKSQVHFPSIKGSALRLDLLRALLTNHSSL